MIQLFQYPYDTLLKTSTAWSHDDTIEGYDDIEKFEHDYETDYSQHFDHHCIGSTKHQAIVEQILRVDSQIECRWNVAAENAQIIIFAGCVDLIMKQKPVFLLQKLPDSVAKLNNSVNVHKLENIPARPDPQPKPDGVELLNLLQDHPNWQNYYGVAPEPPSATNAIRFR